MGIAWYVLSRQKDVSLQRDNTEATLFLLGVLMQFVLPKCFQMPSFYSNTLQCQSIIKKLRGIEPTRGMNMREFLEVSHYHTKLGTKE